MNEAESLREILSFLLKYSKKFVFYNTKIRAFKLKNKIGHTIIKTLSQFVVVSLLVFFIGKPLVKIYLHLNTEGLELCESLDIEDTEEEESEFDEKNGVFNSHSLIDCSVKFNSWQEHYLVDALYSEFSPRIVLPPPDWAST